MVAKTLSRALALLLLSTPAAFGLGLGDIHLLSSLNAPLSAEIELVGATPEELTGLKTQLASRETFARYGLDFPGFLANISAQTGRSADGHDVIKLHSAEAITEPFVTLLLEVSWARGKLIREYTVLLDPPVYTPGSQSGAQAPVAAPASGETARAGEISRAQESSAQPTPSSTPSPTSAPRASAAAAAAGAGTTRLVRRGDTLSRIAGEVSGGDFRSSRKWMVAIYRGNPRAFDGNMNILRSGAELQIPDTETAEAISASDAGAEIRQQVTAWRASSPAPSPEPQSASEPGHLKLVPPTAAPTTPGTGNAAAAGENPALQGRVRDLEAQLQESRRLIELKNAEVAQLQARLSAKQGLTPPPETAKAPPESPTPPAAETPPSTPETAPAEAPPQAAEPAPATPTPAAPRAATEEPQPSLIDKLKDFWWVGAALLIAILALLGLRAWRARQQSEFDDSLGRLATADRDFNTSDTTPVRAIGPEPSFLVEETGTHERPRFSGPSATPPPNVATEDTISSDTAINLDQGDPLAEADFHMAYGLYDQAADLVRIAISREPERRDLKLKLLEVFFVWGNKEQFLLSARELAASRDQAAPGEWEKIVIMGKQLAPEDDLFGSSAAFGAAAAGGVDLDLEGGQSRVDFDLLGEPVPGEHDAVDLDIGSALADREATAESPTRTTDAHLALHGNDDETTATTREITREMPSEPAPVMPDYNLDGGEEAPTVEQPAVPGTDNPTIRQKVDMALKQGGGGDQTAELAIDDLGLDLAALDTVDQPGLGASSDGPTLVAGLDDRSRRVMADAERADEDEHVSATAAWRVRPEDLDPTLPPTRVEALEQDISATSRMTTLTDQDIDFDFDAEEGGGAGAVEFDVGTATVPDMTHAATQRISAEDLALPDLEPVTMSEVGTKLDLARAYMDMGDPEGARNILEEVLQEGSVTQKQEAQRLIDSLPG